MRYILSIDTALRTLQNFKQIRKRYNTGLPTPSPHLVQRSTSMKLHATSTRQYQTITAYDTTGVEINLLRFQTSLVVMPEAEPVLWPVSGFDQLTSENFAAIEAMYPDVVILGTGRRQRFVHPRLTSALTSRQVGVECMDNQAACRTYNILMAEGRRAALALIFDTPAPDLD